MQAFTAPLWVHTSTASKLSFVAANDESCLKYCRLVVTGEERNMLSIHFMSVVQDCLRHFEVQSHMTDAACSVCILCRICQLSRMVELHAVGMPESFFGVFFKTKSQCLMTS